MRQLPLPYALGGLLGEDCLLSLKAGRQRRSTALRLTLIPQGLLAFELNGQPHPLVGEI